MAPLARGAYPCSSESSETMTKELPQGSNSWSASSVAAGPCRKVVRRVWTWAEVTQDFGYPWLIKARNNDLRHGLQSGF